MHKNVGNKWAKIAKLLPNRTTAAVRKHWDATKRRKTQRNQSMTILQEYILSLDKRNENTGINISAYVVDISSSVLTVDSFKTEATGWSSRLPDYGDFEKCLTDHDAFLEFMWGSRDLPDNDEGKYQ